MMNRYKKIGGTLSLLFLGLTTYAQFTLSGEIKPRMEYRHGFKALADSGQKSAIFTDQRTRLNFDYKTDGYQTYVSLQDVRVWGSLSQLNVTDGLTSIHQAWGEAFISKKFSFKFGRQEISYDDHRMFGNVDWAQQARSHDAGLFKYQDSTLIIHVGLAFNQDKAQLKTTNYTVPNSYKSMHYSWVHKDAGNLGISFLALNLGQQVNFINEKGESKFQTNFNQTIGTRTTYKKDKLSFAFNGYYQMGSTNQWPAKSINAYLLGLDATYKINDKTSTTLGFERQSGNSQTDTTKSYIDVQHAFNPYFGTNHKFNGFMDYFYVGNHIGSVGLQDIYLKINYKNEKFNVGLDAHLFTSAAEVLDQVELSENGNIKSISSYLGTELDAYIGFKLAKGVMVNAGYSHMLGSSTLTTLQGINNYQGKPDATLAISNWAYAMIILKPKFFSTADNK